MGFHQKAFRQMRGLITQGAVAAQFSQLSLFNNSSARDLLAIIQVSATAGGAAEVGFSVTQGTQGTSGGLMSPIVTGNAAMAGQLFHQTVGALPSFDFEPTPGTLGQPFNTNYEWLAILSPGWSGVFTLEVVNLAFTLSLVWQLVHPEEIVSDDLTG